MENGEQISTPDNLNHYSNVQKIYIKYMYLLLQLYKTIY